MLRVIQLNTLEDRCIKDKHNWDEAAQFLISGLEQNLKVRNYLNVLSGTVIDNFLFIFLVN